MLNSIYNVNYSKFIPPLFLYYFNIYTKHDKNHIKKALFF